VVVVAGGAGAAVVVGAGCELQPATARLATSRAVANGRLGRMVTPGCWRPRLERLVISLNRAGHKSRSGLSRQRSQSVSLELLVDDRDRVEPFPPLPRHLAVAIP
jgi:hypothetical protein